MEHTQAMQIGELAQTLGLNPKTLRYYEQIGVLPQPQRNANGYRLYTPQDADHLRFILKSKTIGFTLEGIREIVTLQRSGEQPCAHVEALIEEKVADIDAQLRALMDVRAELVALQSEAQHSKTVQGCICAIIEQHGA